MASTKAIGLELEPQPAYHFDTVSSTRKFLVAIIGHLLALEQSRTPSCVAAGSIGMITSIIPIEVTTMIREAPAMTVRQNLGDLLNEVQYRKGKVIITKAGKPVAALVDIALFERIRKLDEEFEQLREELARAFAAVPEKQVEALVDEAVKEARTRRRRK